MPRDFDYEFKRRREDDDAWEYDLALARRALDGADGLSFDARCHMLVEAGMHCLRAPEVLKQYDVERKHVD